MFRLKYRKDEAAVGPIVEAGVRFPGLLGPGVELLLPTPPSNEGRKIQPVRLIAQALADETGIELCTTCVRKKGSTAELKNVHIYSERVKVLRGIFSIAERKVEGRRALVVDDLFRSGATLSALTEALHNGRARGCFCHDHHEDEGPLMSSVFIGGSRKFSRINPLVRERLDSIVDKGLRVVVGDANGADKAVQTYLASKSYRDVVVYCVGRCRNNLGHWEVRAIATDPKARGWRYFAQKDLAMAKDATCGFMLWDGKSKGTVNNLLNLIHLGKTSLLYVSGSPEFMTIRSADDLRRSLAVLSSQERDDLDSKIDLEARLAAEGRCFPSDSRPVSGT